MLQCLGDEERIIRRNNSISQLLKLNSLYLRVLSLFKFCFFQMNFLIASGLECAKVVKRHFHLSMNFPRIIAFEGKHEKGKQQKSEKW